MSATNPTRAMGARSAARRSTVSESSWERFRVMLNQDQLDKLSYIYGALEAEDK